MSDKGNTEPLPEPPDRPPAGSPPPWQQPSGAPSPPDGWPEPGAPPAPTPWPGGAPSPPPPQAPWPGGPAPAQPPGSWPGGPAPGPAPVPAPPGPPGSGPPAGWPPPGYTTPGYPSGPTGWPSGPGGGPGYPPAPRRPSASALVSAAPGVAASLALSVGVGLLFLANLFVALGAQSGTPGRERLLQFLSPADLAVGAVMVLAVALAVWHRPDRVDPPDPAAAPTAPQVRNVALLAGVIAAAVAAASLLRGIVDLTIPHQHGAVKIGNLIDALAAALVAAAAALWGLRAKR